tara:strand:- start:42519 stop:42812 length:294 start_codon:yes stop_codon:yes gene_type:complete
VALVEFQCFSCNKMAEVSPEVGRRDECDHCGADIHCCKNCKFHDAKAYNECKEVQADVVQEKERANFCDYFQLRSGKDNAGSNKEDLLAAAEALFKK